MCALNAPTEEIADVARLPPQPPRSLTLRTQRRLKHVREHEEGRKVRHSQTWADQQRQKRGKQRWEAGVFLLFVGTITLLIIGALRSLPGKG